MVLVEPSIGFSADSYSAYEGQTVEIVLSANVPITADVYVHTGQGNNSGENYWPRLGNNDINFHMFTDCLMCCINSTYLLCHIFLLISLHTYVGHTFMQIRMC